MEQNTTTSGTIGILALTWLMIKFGIAVCLTIFIFTLASILVNYGISKFNNTEEGGQSWWQSIKNKFNK